ncbi:MAG: YigZ family protein [Lentihominibacter sp.]|nr:YigZ family protein [Clostridiales bacterium]MDD6764867.1 YigZ family protein [Bacillota bacterium]MDD6979748.1 YigZ family protein [Bacillota bacterium]MDD7131120.1 YigZ family protein [Bacillota bacterium]MDY6174130.1 YigZ family protein [Lentihominibacter sp.]
MELYRTIRKEACETQIIEKSKFIAHAKPVETREEADKFIGEIKSRYKDATHNVPAMVLGEKCQIQWASDDGEPQGTSGAPMVQMLVGEGLTNLVVVVTRYFGGIKLGTGGLVRAYTSSAKLAVEAAGICSVQQVCRLGVTLDYTYLSRFQQMASESISEGDGGFVIGDINYGEKVRLELITPEENLEKLTGMIANMTAGTAIIEEPETALEKV